jgi:D-alanyl-lipoteichoic acid acyltransferase DltB (MBOAT superfamily)
MTFTTLTFLLFLPLVFALYWLAHSRRVQNVPLVMASFAFYAWWDWRFAGLMLAASLIDFVGALAIEASSRVALRRFWLALSIGSNLTLLGFFKYFHFFVENLQAAASQLGWRFDDVTLNVVLPLGISFYTFQTMSYTIDVYRRQLTPSRSVVEYLAFVTFFPQLVAGPIERAVDLLPQMAAARRFEYASAVDGCRQMLWGFFKKMVLADGLASLVDPIYGAWPTHAGPTLGLATICFAFQIYCDFSAYSDIAIGTARLFGIRLSRNFAYPYFSQNMGEFWRRWHISLSSWFRDYVYIPLGGSRATPVRRAANLLATFCASGLWHGAAWNYVAWGGLNGAAVMPGVMTHARPKKSHSTDVPGGERDWPPLRVALSMLLTFALVCLGWVFFRAASWTASIEILRKIALDSTSSAAWSETAKRLAGGDQQRLLVVLVCFVLVEWIQRRHPHPLHLPATWPRAARWSIYTVLIWFTLYLGAIGNNQFIYFQF